MDLLVLGAGMRGLAAALAARCAAPGRDVHVVDALPQPGGRTQTVRSNGFVCELGEFAFAAEQIEPLRALLPASPSPQAAEPRAARGWLWTGERREPLVVEPLPWSFRGGSDALAQAARVALGPALQLGRTVTAIAPAEPGFAVTLGGQVPTTLVARELVVALPLPVAARLFAPLDPALATTAERLRDEPRAFAFLGGATGGADQLTGFGVIAAEGVATPVAETVFCSEVFAGRALPGRWLVRSDIALAGDPDGDLAAAPDAAVLAAAERELRRWTGLDAAIGFTKLHRFSVPVPDAAATECRIRLQGLAARAPGLTFVGW